jgi:hypothetical protein
VVWTVVALLGVAIAVLSGALFAVISRMDTLRLELRSEIASLRQELGADMAALRQELVARLDAHIERHAG